MYNLISSVFKSLLNVYNLLSSLKYLTSPDFVHVISSSSSLINSDDISQILLAFNLAP